MPLTKLAGAHHNSSKLKLQKWGVTCLLSSGYYFVTGLEYTPPKFFKEYRSIKSK